MGAANVSISKVLKTIYQGPADIAQYIYSDVVYGLANKSQNMKGDVTSVIARYAKTGGVSHTFNKAKANKSPSLKAKFQVTRSRLYGVWGVDGELIEAADGEGAVINAVKEEFDEAMNAFAYRLHMNIHGNRGGARGQISAGSTVSSTTITLLEPNDIVNFEVGMVLQTSTADGTSGTVKTGTVTVSAVNRTTGTITASAAWNAGIPTVAASDYLFVEGDWGQAFYGLGDINPITAPSPSESFWGQDRSIDVERLAGTRTTDSGLNLPEAVMKLVQMTNRNIMDGKYVDTIVMNDARFRHFEYALGGASKERAVMTQATGFTTREGKKVDVNVGYAGIQVSTNRGPAVVYPSVFCPYSVVRCFRKDRLFFGSAGAVPIIEGKNDKDMMLQEDADAKEGRLKAYGNTYTNTPGAFGVMTLA